MKFLRFVCVANEKPGYDLNIKIPHYFPEF
jgi:hypothetical protein